LRWFKSMYTLQGKPDQHVTHISRLIRIWPSTIRISHGPCIATFRESSTGLDRCTTPEKKCSWIHLSAWLSGPWDLPQFFSQHNRWSSAFKPSICWWQTIRLTEPISPAWDQYVQYLLVGANPSILNRHMWGYNFGGADLSHHTLQPSQPTILHFLPKGPVRSQVINLIITN
jgi:hypothetical protein